VETIKHVKMPVMDLQNTLSGLEGSSISNPRIDHEMLAKYIQHISLEGA
jgi:hypothetical protein